MGIWQKGGNIFDLVNFDTIRNGEFLIKLTNINNATLQLRSRGGNSLKVGEARLNVKQIYCDEHIYTTLGQSGSPPPSLQREGGRKDWGDVVYHLSTQGAPVMQGPSK